MHLSSLKAVSSAFMHSFVFGFFFACMCVCLCVFSTGDQAFRPLWFHLSRRVWSQSVCVLCFPMCQLFPGESHGTCEWKELHLFLLSLANLFLCMCCHICVRQVDEVMLTLKQAFSTAAALQSNQTEIQLCEACPMHDLHKLCERIEGDSHPRELVLSVINKHINASGASGRE